MASHARRMFARVSKFKIVICCILCIFIIGITENIIYVEDDILHRDMSFQRPSIKETLKNRSTGQSLTLYTQQRSVLVAERNMTNDANLGGEESVPLNIEKQHGCTEWYNETFQENLRVISNYPRDDVSLFLTKITESRNTPLRMMTSFPVIATAANSMFYAISQGLLKSIHSLLLPKYTDLKIVYYDLGLQPNQVEELKEHCKCEVRRFPFEEFPPHVKMLKTYAWKPIIVQTLLLEFGWVWWMDSSVRFLTPDLDEALNYSVKHHVLFFTYDPVLSVAYNTDAQTMKYLGEDPCKFRPFGEIEATFVLFHFDDVTSTLVEAWCACALSKNCIAPPGSSSRLTCQINKKHDGRCHRFDQAVLSILLRRLYHDQNDYPLAQTPFKIHVIKRGNRVNYFKEIEAR